MRQVGHQHVHGDAPQQSGGYPGDENGRSRGSMPGVSIGVPAGYDAYGHGARRRKRMPIADTVARINGGYADDFGRTRLGRPEPETGAGASGNRQRPLQPRETEQA